MTKNEDIGPTNMGPPPSDINEHTKPRAAEKQRVPRMSCEHDSEGCYLCRVAANKLPLPSWEPAGDRERRYREWKKTDVWPRIGKERYTLGDILTKRSFYHQAVEDPDDPGWDRGGVNILVLDYR